MQDSHRNVEELLLGDLEQLVARVGVEDLEQPLLVVAARWEAGPLQYACDASAQDRDLRRVLAVGGVRVQAQEAALAYADEVEVGGTVHRGALVRLRQRDDAGVAAEAVAGVLLLRLAEDSQPGPVPVAIAEEREVVVGEPLEEGGRLRLIPTELAGGLER